MMTMYILNTMHMINRSSVLADCKPARAYLPVSPTAHQLSLLLPNTFFVAVSVLSLLRIACMHAGCMVMHLAAI